VKKIRRLLVAVCLCAYS